MNVCDSVQPDLAAYLTEELSQERRAEVRAHLDRCAACSQAYAEVQQASRLLTQAPLESRPPGDLEARVMKLVELERAARKPTRQPVDVEPQPSRVTARVKTRWSRVAPVLAPALATGVVILGVAGSVWHARVDELESRMNRIERRYGTWGHTVQSVSLTSEGDGAVSGRAELVEHSDDNYRLVLRADGLPKTPAGAHYEVWLSGPDGWASAGSFRVHRSGPLTLNFQIGVDPNVYPRLWITLEPDDGNPARTGPEVMEAWLNL